MLLIISHGVTQAPPRLLFDYSKIYSTHKPTEAASNLLSHFYAPTHMSLITCYASALPSYGIFFGVFFFLHLFLARAHRDTKGIVGNVVRIMLTCHTNVRIGRRRLILPIRSGVKREENKSSFHSLPSALFRCTTWCHIHL